MELCDGASSSSCSTNRTVSFLEHALLSGPGGPANRGPGTEQGFWSLALGFFSKLPLAAGGCTPPGSLRQSRSRPLKLELDSEAAFTDSDWQVEDPVSTMHSAKRCRFLQRQLGAASAKFARAARLQVAACRDLNFKLLFQSSRSRTKTTAVPVGLALRLSASVRLIGFAASLFAL